jgi:hypothetical protein
MVVGSGFVCGLSRFAMAFQSVAKTSDDKEIAAVQATAQKAGLEPFNHSRSEHFLGLGDADDRFRKRALEICESLAGDFIKHFRGKGFNLTMPKERLTVITLKNDISYQAYSGIDPGPSGGGHYDLDTNRLVMFDFRPKGREPAGVANPVRVNLLALVHETTHLLCFNTGLLSRKGDVPKWVSEGLATYVEMWQKKPTEIGAVNIPWLEYLKTRKIPWIPIPDLIAIDNTFDVGETDVDDKRPELSYAESWLLVHYLMRETQLPRFRAYLAELPTDGTAAQRVEYAEKHLGSLKALDRTLTGKELKRLLR